ncbi:CYTH domain-containing protein [Urechidicola vernalis]|uniref:CYTH domain-containing protein n=1 Tax=Urechidicola vernalis TaxID=3075600 RepID=A0ABU2Y5Y6_9FLAO|nr:CYTH domain-containing protein [Urechidicola sp. P050]MDT0553606.1 CYTH domain-containing protein [Urechidicola sp. P050]
MPLEIERKFLIKNSSYKTDSFKVSFIKQGFLNSNKNRVVRVRILDNSGFLTIKGISSSNGTSRFEWEKEIPLEEANELFQLCEKGVIEKYRYYVNHGDHIYEIDEFKGENEGLVIGEVELGSVDESFSKPTWVGVEVTGDTKFYNSELSKNPFSKWV